MAKLHCNYLIVQVDHSVPLPGKLLRSAVQITCEACGRLVVTLGDGALQLAMRGAVLPLQHARNARSYCILPMTHCVCQLALELFVSPAH